jgi:hypothetical protein
MSTAPRKQRKRWPNYAERARLESASDAADGADTMRAARERMDRIQRLVAAHPELALLFAEIHRDIADGLALFEAIHRRMIQARQGVDPDPTA